jgi:phage terminase small subunit
MPKKKIPARPKTKAVARPKTKRRAALNPKQQCFITEYLVDKNATQAAIRSGYSRKTACEQAYDLLRKPQIAKAIKKALAAQEKRVGITKDEWLRELKIIGFSDLANHIKITKDTGAICAKSFSEMPKDTRRALESITEIRTIHEDAKGEQSVVNERVTFKLHPKIKALEDIGDHFGWLGKNVKLSGDVNLTGLLSIADLRASLAARKKKAQA